MINKQKSAGLAYLLEILLFPFGAGWFYLNRVAHAVIHLVFGIILGAISWRMGWLLILAIRLDAINDHGTYVSNLMNNAPIQFLILILYAIWFAIDMIALKDGIAETNQEIMEQDQNYMMRMSQMFGHNPQSPVPTSAATPVEQKVEPTTVQPTTQRKKQATSTMNNQLDSKAWTKVVQNEKQTEEYQKFQNAYYDITNHLENGKLKRSYQLLEDEDYATASQYFEELLIAGEDQSLVYLGP